MAVDTKLVVSDGESSETSRVYSLYRCGGSKKKPLCDGSHEENGFRG
jgi:CDGSH-type Zn-finger protein